MKEVEEEEAEDDAEVNRHQDGLVHQQLPAVSLEGGRRLDGRQSVGSAGKEVVEVVVIVVELHRFHLSVHLEVAQLENGSGFDGHSSEGLPVREGDRGEGGVAGRVGEGEQEGHDGRRGFLVLFCVEQQWPVAGRVALFCFEL